MNEKEWEEYEKLHRKYEEARSEYHAAQMHLRGAFSELARSYDKSTLDHNRLYEEELAHERFVKAREKLHAFLKDKLEKE